MADLLGLGKVLGAPETLFLNYSLFVIYMFQVIIRICIYDKAIIVKEQCSKSIRDLLIGIRIQPAIPLIYLLESLSLISRLKLLARFDTKGIIDEINSTSGFMWLTTR